jgi:hypothetical protein
MNRDGWVFVAVVFFSTAAIFYNLGYHDGKDMGVQCPQTNAGERLLSSDQRSCQYAQQVSYGRAIRKVRVAR